MSVQEASYTRLYADAVGESHFARADVQLTASNFAPPAPPLEVSAPMPAEQVVFTRPRAGWFGDWHPTPRRQWYINLKGRLDIEASDGEALHLGPGDAVLLEDTTGRGHRTRVIGDEDALGVFVQLPDWLRVSRA